MKGRMVAVLPARWWNRPVNSYVAALYWNEDRDPSVIRVEGVNTFRGVVRNLNNV
jgi:hypothetical protein